MEYVPWMALALGSALFLGGWGLVIGTMLLWEKWRCRRLPK